MFISSQTKEGLLITVCSAVELIPFFLRERLEYVLTERFCQDPIEEPFGDQRKLWGHSENTDMHRLGYQTNALIIQKQITCTSGNTRGRYDRKTLENVSDEPIPKRRNVNKK